MQEEIWKDVVGYEGLYQVSNIGRVKSTKRSVMLSLKSINRGYIMAGLSKDGKIKMLRVHRLVAQAFIPNTHNKPFINHIDSNKKNNKVENLEWCTCSENNFHSRNSINGGFQKINKAVYKCNKQGEVIEAYKSISEAGRNNNVSKSAISFHANYNSKPIRGFIWKFASKEE